jgi:hypothetical protein
MPIEFSHFLRALSLLELEKFKRREMVVITFPMQKSLFFLKTLNIHSFLYGGSMHKYIQPLSINVQRRDKADG